MQPPSQRNPTLRRLGKRLGLALVLLLLASLAWSVRHLVPPRWLQQARLVVYGISVDRQQQLTSRDGTVLRGTLYRPTRAEAPLASILIRLPYGRDLYGEAVGAAIYFARHGYAVLVQDVRGKHDSGGRFMPWQHATEDGVDTLDWLVRQPWSNGKVGTWGCSALGELQFALARARHPAHAAMVPIGAGGGIGTAGDRYGYFGLYEGGVFQLASGFGWLVNNGEAEPAQRRQRAPVDIAAALKTLPVSEMVSRVRPGPNAWDQFTRRPLTDPSWSVLDYVGRDDTLSTPALNINTWGDQTLDGTLALAEQARRTSPGTPHHVVIAPGNHCEHDTGAALFGELRITNGQRAWYDEYRRWFDWWLRGQGGAAPDWPAYRYYMLGEDQWLDASRWPPEDARAQRWYLHSGGRANGRDGDGRLLPQAPAAEASDTYRHDPMDPVPSRGGPLCCTGDPADRAGPADQADVEKRRDVLVYTSEPLARPLRIAGPLSARLVVETSAADTDFIARLVDVAPDGRALGIQEGALRLRYRGGIAHPQPARPGERYEIEVPMRSIAYRVPAGHRIRLHVASSSFPRLERHLGSAGSNLEASEAVVADNRVHHGPAALSQLLLHVLSDTAADTAVAR